MKTIRSYTAGALALSLSTAFAGPAPATSPTIVTAPEADAFKWLTPTLNIRARFEQRDVSGLESSKAFTVRERLGLKTASFNGFSAFVEGEFLQTVEDDYSVGNAALTPFNPGKSTILDPETNELNQAYLKYSGDTFTFIGGRQRIKLNGDAFIGNVGWRQNEQTYDAATVIYKPTDDLSIQYTYSDSVNRIFGNDASGALFNFKGDFNFINIDYKGVDGIDLTAYGVLIDLDPGFGPPRSSGDTIGLIAKGKASGFNLYGEVAQQFADRSTDEDATYIHLKASTKVGSHTVGLGFESLGEDLYTPFATVHAFNGFADVLAGARIGLGSGHDGIHDAYAFHSTKLPGGFVWKNWLHVIDAENGAGADMSGWEYDSVIVKKLTDNLKAIGKVYHFESDDDLAAPTTSGFTIGLNYTY